MAKKKSESEISSDEITEVGETKTTQSPGSLSAHTKNFLKNLNKKQKILIGLGSTLLLVALLVLTVKPLRLAALNLFSDATIVVVVYDNTTDQPVVGAEVLIDLPEDQNITARYSGATDEDGRAKIGGLDYGNHDVTILKEAYEPATSDVSLEQNEQEFTLSLTPTGIPISLQGINSLTGEKIGGFDVTDAGGTLATKADENGLAKLNVPPGTTELELTINLDGYNQVTRNITLVDDDGAPLPQEDLEEVRQVQLVMAGRHHFLSNRKGPIGLWSSNYDGSDATPVIEDLGRRSGSLRMSLSPDGKYAVMAAPIKGVRDDNGNLLNELYLVNLESGENRLFDEGDNARFNVLTVENDRVVYSVTIDDRNVINRGKIKSYTFSTDSLKTHLQENEISAESYLQNRVLLTREFTKRVKCNYCSDGIRLEYTGQGFVVVDLADDSLEVVEKDQWVSPVRNPRNQDEIFYSYWDDDTVWKKYHINTGENTRLDNRPGEIDDPYPYDHPSPSGQTLAWVETRDGTGALITTSNGSIDDSSAVDTKDLRINYIVRWVDDSLIIVNGSEIGGESGDFIVHLDSGNYQLISKIYKSTYYYRYGYYGY